ncbi:MAG: 50S ribosomal protein L21 [Chthonomonadales bacterium]|nr:50S ribosomal protein L21 [Chthonomonadales bacterium]
MYAIVRTGGKQYRVSRNTVFAVEKLNAAEGDTVELNEVLLVADGENVRVGAPLVEGARVSAKVIEVARGRKVRGFTYKPTKNEHRRYGHRQWHTRLRVESIEG